jgi:hypothetical protein
MLPEELPPDITKRMPLDVELVVIVKVMGVCIVHTPDII